MNFTLDELINAIKYHGHQYGLTTLEILEGLKEDFNDDAFAEVEKKVQSEIAEQLQTILDKKVTKKELIHKLEVMIFNLE